MSAAPAPLHIPMDIGGSRHDYVVGRCVLAELGPRVATHVRSGVCALVADAGLAQTPHLAAAEASLRSAGFACVVLPVPSGETSKSIAQAERLWDAFAECGLAQDGAVVALGGGVVGDLAGFCAATYMRGVALVHVPTTLLAMCDSSVGGKTALDLACGKNMVGAFHQPFLVLADVATLDTLPPREYRSGFGEVVKCAMLRDPGALSRLRGAAESLLAREPEPLARTIAETVEVKLEHVRGDVEDRAGRRALLNLGHTTAHAVEAESGYADVLHGEAVAGGLVVAARIAAGRGLLDRERERELVATLRAFGLPTSPPDDLDPTRIVARTRHDKKRRGGRRRMVLPLARGGADLYEVDDAELAIALVPADVD